MVGCSKGISLFLASSVAYTPATHPFALLGFAPAYGKENKTIVWCMQMISAGSVNVVPTEIDGAYISIVIMLLRPSNVVVH